MLVQAGQALPGWVTNWLSSDGRMLIAVM